MNCKLLTFVLLLPNFLFSQINLDSGLVAHYPFEGDANDLSTNGINGTAYNVSYSTGVYGAPNSSIVFEGSDSSYVDAGTDNRGISDTIAISAFIRTTFDGIGDIVSKYDPGNDEGYHFQLSLGKIRFAGRDGGGDYRSTGFSLTTINDSAWHHVLGVVRGNSWLLYVDCTLEGAQSNSTVNPDISSNAELGIGKDVFSDSKFLDCEVDEVRIYDRELHQDEMDSLCATAVFASNPTLPQAKEIHLQLYPNPTTDRFAIATDMELNASELEIYSLDGKRVWVEKISGLTPIIDVSFLQTGNYIVKITTNRSIVTKKLVVK